MGCGQSKDDPERELVISKFTPLLRRRFQEIKGRKNNKTDSDGTLSKKGLLKHSNHEDDPSLSNSHNVDENDSIDRKSESACEESVKLSSASYLKDEDKREEPKSKENKAENVEEESEAERRLSNVDFSYICPGSPSFRIYCVDQPLENANDDETDESKDDECDQKYHGDDNGEIVPSTDSNELPQESMNSESVTQTKGKGKKGGRFMKVMCKGKSAGAVNNLLNVTSCYHPSKTHRHNPRVLPQQDA